LTGVASDSDCAGNMNVGVAAATGEFSLWSGTWGDSLASGGYGGWLYLCASQDASGVVRVDGMYSETGYVRGVATGSVLVGEWFEPGLPGSTPSYGNFTLTMSSDGSFFTGSWTYGASSNAAAGTWNERRVSWLRPADDKCFVSSAGVGTPALSGHLAVSGSGGTEYDVCVEGNVLTGSYQYVYTDNSTVLGYERALCVTPTVAPGAPVCMGLWYEPGFMGVFMNVVKEAGVSTYDTWWGGLTDDLDFAKNVKNGDEHGVEVEMLTGVSTSAQCSNYTNLMSEFSSAAIEVDWTGTYIDTDPAYGTMYLCQGADGVVQGSYGGLGIVQGVAEGFTLRGMWYEVGEGTGSMPSHGEFTWTLEQKRIGNTTNVWFSGSWTYGSGDAAVAGGSWLNRQVNDTRPSNKECFWSDVGSALSEASAATWSGLAPWNERLSGRFKVTSGDPPAVFDLCISGQGLSSGSYWWELGGSPVRSFQQGRCFGGGRLCSGKFFDQNQDGATSSGVWLTLRTSSALSQHYQALDMWWYGTAADANVSNIGNADFQGVDEQVLTGPTQNCSGNAGVVAVASSDRFLSWVGAWTDSLDSGGYGGSLYLCHNSEANTVEGMYSSIGYVRGTVMGSYLVGRWVEPGGVLGSTGVNTGRFSLQLQENGAFFMGVWASDAMPDVWHTWEERRVSVAAPSDDECMVAAGPSAMDGLWLTPSGNNVSYCTSQATQVVSGSSVSARTGAASFEVGPCLFDGTVCSGLYFEGAGSTEPVGSFLIVRRTPTAVSGVWWAGLPADLNFVANGNNPDKAGTISLRLAGVTTPSTCSANSALVTTVGRQNHVFSWSGSWTSAGYGGQFRLCQSSLGSTTLVTGVYSEIGYVRGRVVGNTIVGEWFEVGDAAAVPNHGNFTLTMGGDGATFTGSWMYGASEQVAGTWNETRLDWNRPSDVQCFASQAGVSGASGGDGVQKTACAVLCFVVLLHCGSLCFGLWPSDLANLCGVVVPVPVLQLE